MDWLGSHGMIDGLWSDFRYRTDIAPMKKVIFRKWVLWKITKCSNCESKTFFFPEMDSLYHHKPTDKIWDDSHHFFYGKKLFENVFFFENFQSVSTAKPKNLFLMKMDTLYHHKTTDRIWDDSHHSFYEKETIKKCVVFFWKFSKYFNYETKKTKKVFLLKNISSIEGRRWYTDFETMLLLFFVWKISMLLLFLCGKFLSVSTAKPFNCRYKTMFLGGSCYPVPQQNYWRSMKCFAAVLLWINWFSFSCILVVSDHELLDWVQSRCIVYIQLWIYLREKRLEP